MITFLTIPYSEAVGCLRVIATFKDESLISDFEDRTMSKCTVLFMCFLVAHRYIRMKLYA